MQEDRLVCIIKSKVETTRTKIQMESIKCYSGANIYQSVYNIRWQWRSRNFLQTDLKSPTWMTADKTRKVHPSTLGSTELTRRIIQKLRNGIYINHVHLITNIIKFWKCFPCGFLCVCFYFLQHKNRMRLQLLESKKNLCSKWKHTSRRPKKKSYRCL